MIWRLSAFVAILLVSCSCTRQTVSVPTPKPVSHPSAVAVAMRRQAINAVDAGDGDLRVRALRQKMAAEPGNLAVRLELARHYEQRGFPEVAAEHYRLAAEQFPAAAEVQVRLAKLLRNQGMVAQAAAGLAKFLEGRKPVPELADAFSLLGILRDEMGDLKAAEAAHRAAAELRPDQDRFHNNLGYNLLLQGDAGAAAKEFRRALSIRPDSQIARNNLGLALAAEPKEAVLQWQSVSGPAAAHSNLAAVLIEKGQYAEARRELEIALGYKRDHLAALRNLQLLSEMDGGEAAFRQRSFDPWWKRFCRAFGKAVVGYETPASKEAPQTASR